MVLNLGPLDWESSALINWPLLRVSWENNVIPNVSALVNTGLTECAVCLMSACLFVWSFSGTAHRNFQCLKSEGARLFDTESCYGVLGAKGPELTFSSFMKYQWSFSDFFLGETAAKI